MDSASKSLKRGIEILKRGFRVESARHWHPKRGFRVESMSQTPQHNGTEILPRQRLFMDMEQDPANPAGARTTLYKPGLEGVRARLSKLSATHD